MENNSLKKLAKEYEINANKIREKIKELEIEKDNCVNLAKKRDIGKRIVQLIAISDDMKHSAIYLDSYKDKNKISYRRKDEANLI